MLLLTFLTLVVSVCCQVATPPRRVGFQYIPGHSFAKVQLEVFLDLICPDSKEAWPHLKEVATFFGPKNVNLLVHLFPLPYHQNAFYASRAAFVIHYLTNGTKTFDWIDTILLEKQTQLADRNFHNNSDADLLRLFGKWATDIGVNETQFVSLVDRTSSNEFESYTRVMWKMACSRGVAGTPTFFINGINHPNIQPTWTLTEWKQFLEPLLRRQLFDDVDDVHDVVGSRITDEPCTDKDSRGTTSVTSILNLILPVAGLAYSKLTM